MFALTPKDPKITIDRDAEGKPKRYCIDAKTEQFLQRGRVMSMAASGLIIYAGFRLKRPLWLKLSLIGIGASIFYTSHNARKAITDAEKL
tara:strand:- start:1624 stop:1893 length:270 start_codon:yes stop_codon:yes gene_type:complete